ncbi:MAG TPA: hemerythrin domain-containing protein [Trebonia sp.]|nr:hemerythrin domain-containing protein [Trebonia sp.]
MTTRSRPGRSDAARHGTGDADLTIMLAAHAAFRRDLRQLAQAAAFADLPDPGRRASVQAGWELLKRQLHLHHTAEDAIVWPALRERLAHSDHAQSVLDAMESEHQQIDPLLTAVDDAFARAEAGHRVDAGAVGDAADALAASLAGHLAHEERDGLPLIGEALTSAEWRSVGFKIVRKNGLSAGGEMFAWLADGADPGQAAAAIGTLPPPARLAYRAIWRPRYRRTQRW